MLYYAKHMKVLLLACLLTCGAACKSHETVQMTLVIENARGPAGLSLESLPPIQQVTRFLVTVSGEDLTEPVIIPLDANSTGTSLEDIPDGGSRTILVEALNSEGMVVRRREVTGITIDKEQTEPIVVSLNTVPLFTNLRNGNRVIVSRLQILGVGEPGNSLEIDDDYEGTIDILLDVSAGTSVINPSMSAGDFTLVPPELALGWHTFTLRDLDNGEQSQIRFRLVPPGVVPGTGIVSFGGIQSSHNTAGGIPFHSFDIDVAHFPGVLVRSVQ